MPKVGKGGKRHDRGKTYDEEAEKIDAPHKADGQEYAQVSRMLGNGRCSATLMTPQRPTRLCMIPGKFTKRKIWINPGDLIMVNIRSFQEDKCDIIYKFSTEEIKQLKKDGHIDKNFQISNDLTATEHDKDEDDVFEFDDDDEIDLADL